LTCAAITQLADLIAYEFGDDVIVERGDGSFGVAQEGVDARVRQIGNAS
jgi:hypothetical protein